jgi:hypothetical protein
LAVFFVPSNPPFETATLSLVMRYDGIGHQAKMQREDSNAQNGFCLGYRCELYDRGCHSGKCADRDASSKCQ